jgi:polysaccharide pyruvyl transferase
MAIWTGKWKNGAIGKPRYGLLSYRWSGNLGDEIQSIAARRFLPSVDLVVDRESLDRNPRFNRTFFHVILNGWFMHRPHRWPPHPHVRPLITSFHLSNEILIQNQSGVSAANALLEGRAREYLIEHEPIGARDLATLELLERKGVRAFFSGCLSLTLARPTVAGRRDYVCVNNLDPESVAFVQARTAARVIQTTHTDWLTIGFARRMRKAEALLSLYAGAKCVITSRLHCALPCIALGTPVLLVTLQNDNYRFSGLADLIRCCTREAFLSGLAEFDIEHPTPNSEGHLALRQRLAESVAAFVADAGGQSRHAPAACGKANT